MSLTFEHIKNAINVMGRGMPLESRAALDALAATPELAAVLDREDEALQSRRRKLVAELDDLPRQMKARLDRAGKDHNAAQKALQEAERALLEARGRASTAAVAMYGAGFAFEGEKGRRETELDATADPRLQRLIDHGHVLLQATRDVSWSLTWTEGRTWNGDPIVKFETNLDEVTAARAEIARVMSEVAALKRKPLLRHQVTKELKSLLLDLDAAVSGFDLSFARLGEFGDLVVDEVKSMRDLTDRASAASRRAADASEAA